MRRQHWTMIGMVLAALVATGAGADEYDICTGAVGIPCETNSTGVTDSATEHVHIAWMWAGLVDGCTIIVSSANITDATIYGFNNDWEGPFATEAAMVQDGTSWTYFYEGTAELKAFAIRAEPEHVEGVIGVALEGGATCTPTPTNTATPVNTNTPVNTSTATPTGAGGTCAAARLLTSMTTISDVSASGALLYYLKYDIPAWGGYLALAKQGGANITSGWDYGWGVSCEALDAATDPVAWSDAGYGLWWTQRFTPVTAGVHYTRLYTSPVDGGTYQVQFYGNATYTPTPATPDDTATPTDTPENTVTPTPTDTSAGNDCAEAHGLIEGVTLTDINVDGDDLIWIRANLTTLGARLQITNATLTAVTDTTWMYGGCTPAGAVAWVTESAGVWVSGWYTPVDAGAHYIGLTAAPDDVGDFYIVLEEGETPTPTTTATAAETATVTRTARADTPTATPTVTWTPTATYTPTNTATHTPTSAAPTSTMTVTETALPGPHAISAVVASTTVVEGLTLVERVVIHCVTAGATLALRDGGAGGVAKLYLSEATAGNTRERVWEHPGVRFGTNIYATITNGTAEIHWRRPDEYWFGR